ncbi:MAG TPA: CHAT domain-containing protein [Caldimonas sp.]|nr:CHAT domain-containing protein [Caldimonas sp.]HEX4233645.1 CHAT domain-containing protein [Caldimonas sp.]
MPVRTLAGSDLSYALVVFDENGVERAEADRTMMSETIAARLADPAQPATDVFLIAHGWQGDVPAAIVQFDRWIAAMAAVESDRVAARNRPGGFAPVIIGLHWPSLPFGDETVPAGESAVLSAAGTAGATGDDESVDAWARRIADTPRARSAIETILGAARHDTNAGAPSPALLQAYAVLYEESGLESRGSAAPPGADQDAFDPKGIIAQSQASAAKPATQLLGITDTLSGIFLSPLRQLSFWKMKDRARSFGESGAHALLVRLQTIAPQVNFHVMGHSFGCIVASATVAGPAGQPDLPRPVESLFLVQGALSLWSYANDIPYAPGTAGYFNRIVSNGLVRGPIVTTRSTFDTAVGRLYPLGAQIKKQLVLGDSLPAYGGIGSFGIQGTAKAEDMPMQPATFRYAFRPGAIYNLEASGVIKNGDGVSGAHSDIAHPEVAHAFWSAVLAGPVPPSATLSPTALAASASAPGSSREAPPARPRGGLLGSGPLGPIDVKPAFGTTASRAPVLRSPAPTQQQPQQPQLQVQQQERPSSPPQPARGQRAMPPATRDAPDPPIASPPVAAGRWVNVALEDQPPGMPLRVRSWYTLAFDVDVAQHAEAIASAGFADESLFPADVDEISVTVQLDSADFTIDDPVRSLRVPRSGKSSNKARFDISPLHDGKSTITATLHKDGNFVQNIAITFTVGGNEAVAVESTARGRPPAAASVLRPRDIGVSLSIGDGGYECVVWGEVAARARLPLQPAYLASAIDALRHDLMKVVMQQDSGGNYVFQAGIDIADADRDAALTTMARAGALLFQKIFFGPGAGADSKSVGTYLREAASDPTRRLKLQIVAESAPIPWGLLYVGDAAAGAKLDWDQFVGMRHIVEEIPLQTTLAVADSAIASEPQLAVSVNVNAGIDAQLGITVVADQETYWTTTKTKRPRLGLISRDKRDDIVRALADASTDDQIVYFYCHAVSVGLDGPGGPDASTLELTDAKISLAELALDAPTSTPLRGKPLVFLNACESAELSPAFYDGFVPYFMAKGARGVVGTQCQTPALFAATWAERFFDRFLGGDPLGEVFLDLRREFLQSHGNPLGLLYAVHCDGDTRIEPALA